MKREKILKREIKILIADDHKLVRKGVRLMLSAQREFTAIIKEVASGKDVLSMLKKDTFDVLLLDISMPDMDGLQVLKKVKSLLPSFPVLMLTMHNDENTIKKAIDLGASGYLLKNSDVSELVLAIQSVVDNQPYFANEVTQVLLNGHAKSALQLEDDGILSEKEIQILSLIVKELTSREIGEQLCLSFRTVEGYRKKIMEKLMIKSTIGLVKYAMLNNIR